MATEQQDNYMSWYESYEGKKEGAFMKWYHSYKGKKIVNIIYSVGASVVIVGALFKILHWPGASQVLMVGMFTEAFLFIIGALEAPHEEFHWANVFPELLEYGSPDERVERSLAERGKKGMRGGNGATGSAAPALSETEMSALKDGISDLAKTAGQLSALSKVATDTTALGEKMAAATAATDSYVNSMNGFGQKSEELNKAYTTLTEDMQSVMNGTKAYQQSVEAIGAKLSSLNSVYEMQLNAMQSQVEAYKAQTAKVEAVSAQVDAIANGMQKMQETNAEALKSQVAYEDASKKLAAQVADLNKIYGNMLNALA